jgi:hypothetical protein
VTFTLQLVAQEETRSLEQRPMPEAQE